MRTVSFSDAHVQKKLNDDFVCCTSNISGEPTSGRSFSHSPIDAPGPCGRSAGRQNVQVIFLTPPGEIFHVAAGFLSPDDLLAEMKFAQEMFSPLQDSPDRPKFVVDTHARKLADVGYSLEEIITLDSSHTDRMSSRFSPLDNGIKLTSPGTESFMNRLEEVPRQRFLKDHRFMMENPLMTQRTFARKPELLVGRHASFFGSNEALNGVGAQVNQAIEKSLGNNGNRRRGNRSR